MCCFFSSTKKKKKKFQSVLLNPLGRSTGKNFLSKGGDSIITDLSGIIR